MTRAKVIIAGGTVIVIFLLQSCKHGCGHPGGSSSNGSKHSHNMGLNCLNCHSGTGTGEGCFEIGGTAYHADKVNTYPGCTIDFYTQQNGQGDLVTSLVSDGKGNLYTGRNINWGNGLFPVITSPDGHREYMVEPISHGACNSCHGSTTERIFVN